MLQGQKHQEMKENESTYWMLEVSRSNRSGGSICLWKTQFHRTSAEEYLHELTGGLVLSRVTVPINWQLSALPVREVSEGRSIHS